MQLGQVLNDWLCTHKIMHFVDTHTVWVTQSHRNLKSVRFAQINLKKRIPNSLLVILLGENEGVGNNTSNKILFSLTKHLPWTESSHKLWNSLNVFTIIIVLLAIFMLLFQEILAKKLKCVKIWTYAATAEQTHLTPSAQTFTASIATWLEHHVADLNFVCCTGIHIGTFLP